MHINQEYLEKELPLLGFKVIATLVVIVGAWFMSGWARQGARKALHTAKFDETLTKFFSNTVKWIVLITAVLCVMSIFGIQATSFAAIIAAAGLALGLAFQGTLANFASGVMLLIFRPFKVGDTVKVANQTGTIDEIDLFTTALDTADRKRIIIPNNMVFGQVIENTSHHTLRRVDVDFGVSPLLSASACRAAFEARLLQVKHGTPGRDRNVILNGITATSTDWQIQVWGPVSDMGKIREEVLMLVREGIESIL